MTEVLYVTLPKGVTTAEGKRPIFQLRRSLYGIKQAPVIWQRTLANTLTAFGLTATLSDPCVFVKREGANFLILGVYVDDLLIVASTDDMVTEFKRQIVEKYQVRDQGPLDGTSYLNMKTHYDRDRGVLHVSNDKMAMKILRNFGFDAATPAESPTIVDGDRDNTSVTANFPIRSFIGAVTYLSTTVRPDLALAVNALAGTASDPPTQSDYADATRMARYIARDVDKEIGLRYDASKFDSPTDAIRPRAYADADHCKIMDFKSRSGHVIYMAGAPVYWRSQKQKTIATSSTEAEVISLSDICKRVVWMRSLLNELGFDLPPVEVFEDNQACLDLQKISGVRERSRHIDVRFFWTRELEAKGLCRFRKIDTKENIADFFTKVLPVKVQRAYISSLCGPRRL